MTAAERYGSASAVPRASGRGRLTILRRLFVYHARRSLREPLSSERGSGRSSWPRSLFPLSRLRHRRAPAIERAAACQRWLQRAFVMLFDYMRLCGLIALQPARRRHVDAGTALRDGREPPDAGRPRRPVRGVRASRLRRQAAPVPRADPGAGRCARCAYLEGGETEGLAGGAVVNQALDRIAQSMPMLVFPEGTRSPAGGLRRFRRGPFEIACRANVPIVPVLIRCEPLALGKGTPWYDVPSQSAVLTVTRLPAMNPAAFGGNAGAMTEACEEIFRRHLGLTTAETRTAI